MALCIGEAKLHVQARQKKLFICYFPSMGRETSAASRISSRAMITQGDKYRKHKCLPSSSFPCALTSFPCALTISHILWYGTSFWSVWVPVLAVSPPSFWWTFSLLSRRADWEEENLHSVKALPRKSPNLGILSTLLSSQIQSAAPRGCYEENSLHPSQIQYNEPLNFWLNILCPHLHWNKTV